jgi:hypothetical protein
MGHFLPCIDNKKYTPLQPLRPKNKLSLALLHITGLLLEGAYQLLHKYKTEVVME